MLDCGLEVSEFKLQLPYYVHFQLFLFCAHKSNVHLQCPITDVKSVFIVGDGNSNVSIYMSNGMVGMNVSWL